MKLLGVLLALTIGTLAGTALHAQTQAASQPVNVSLSDLLNHASDYDGKLVQTTGEIHLAFEEFTIVDPKRSDA